MTAYLYWRTSDIEEFRNSSDLQEELAAEKNQLTGFAQRQDCRKTLCVTDRDQAWMIDFRERPEAQKLLTQLQAGDSIFVSTLSRIFSSTEDMYDCFKTFRETGVSLYVMDMGTCLTRPDCHVSFASVVRQFHRLEQRRSRERIKAVKLRQKQKGRFLGGSRPFGYMIHSNGRLIENPMEQRVLKKILSLKSEGKSLRKISETVSTPVMPVSFKTVQRILKRHEEGTALQ